MNPVLYIFQFLNFALEVYSWVFTAYIFMSWIPMDPSNPIVRFIKGLCEPLYRWILRVLPPLRFGMVDFSVFYVFILFILIRYGLAFLAGLFV